MTYFKTLLDIGVLAREIKAEIEKDQFITDYDIAEYIEKKISSNTDLFLAFPTNVVSDWTLCHVTPEYKKPIVLKNTRIYTVDFGIQSRATGFIVDNAITVSHEPLLSQYLKSYKSSLEEIKTDLQNILDDVGVITVAQVSAITEKRLSEGLSSKLYIVDFACAHTIEKNKLHGVAIPMRKRVNVSADDRRKLSEGTVFTIEPHVLILDLDLSPKTKSLKRIKLYETEGNIAKRKGYHYYERLQDLVNQNVPKGEYTLVSRYDSNFLSFYVEDTFIILNKKIVTVT